jgi:hypothetical protein
VNRDGASADSSQVEFNYNNAPPGVSAVRISDITYNSVRLTWGRSAASDFSAYVIEYREYPTGTWKTSLRINNRNTTSAVAGGLQSDTAYEFRIKVQDSGGKTSPVTVWSVRPRTDENVAYEIFSTVFGDPAVCLPISFMLLFMTAAGAAGMAKSRNVVGSAIFGCFAAGFGMLVIANLLQLMEVFAFSPEQKLILFVLPIPFAVAIAVARKARRARNAARERAESERRAAEERAAEQRRRADEIRAKLEALGPRLAGLERTRGPAGAPEARNLLAQAGQAYSTGNLDAAQELAGRAETGMREMEDADRDRRAQAESVTKQLEKIDTHLQALINM